jgi:dUTP pyrophosphatase
MVDFSGLRVKLLHLNAKLPARSSEGAAGYDLVTPSDFLILAGQNALVPLGFSAEMPHGLYGKIFDRSGMSWKFDVEASAGVIDNDYRGEWKVLLRNHGQCDVEFCVGDRIAQVVFMFHQVLSVNIVDELQDSIRGEGGFGSTGR